MASTDRRERRQPADPAPVKSNSREIREQQKEHDVPLRGPVLAGTDLTDAAEEALRPGRMGHRPIALLSLSVVRLAIH